MKTFYPNPDVHPVIHALKALIHKFRQHPGIYPIKYFKKGNRPDKYKKQEFLN
jgi:hypothetical protein